MALSRERAKAAYRDLQNLRAALADQSKAPPAPGFAAALKSAKPNVAVIAEIKRRSPSKGVINETLSARERGHLYAGNGASALSVLTEPEQFGGSLDDLSELRKSEVPVPLLRKDFITDTVQLLEAKVYGASAVLLIARGLSPVELTELAGEAIELGLEILVEVRSEAELERALMVPGAVVGVNSRNLETLQVSPDVTAKLIPMIPSDRVAVWESGVASRADVERAADLGADAVLVGSVLSASSDPAALLGELATVTWKGRG